MAENKKLDVCHVLRDNRIAYGLIERIDCSGEQNAEYARLLKDGGTLPEGVYQYVYDHSTEATGEFYTLSENSLSEADTKEYLTFRKLNYLRTIKNCVLFFTVLAAVGIAGFLISLVAGAAALR